MKRKIYLLAVMSICAFSSAQDRPNLLFIILDDAGLDMGAYGSTFVNTPAFDLIASRGVLFENAYTPNAKCAPSRAAILTGRNSWQLDAAANHFIYFPQKFKTFQEVLGENGYTIGYTGKGYAPGIAQYEDGCPRELVGPAFNSKKLSPPTKAISSNDYSENFKDFLNTAPKNKPWSFWLGTLEPHRAYAYRSGEGLGKKKAEMITDFPGYWPDNEVTRNDLLDYAYEIEYADSHVLKILKSLEASGELKNTLVVMTSDHGMPFPRVKGDQYEHSNHIPMALMWGNKVKVKGRRIKDHISFIDLAPTFLDIAGISWQDSGMHPAAGLSFLDIITSEKSGQIDINRNYVLVGKERHDTGRPDDVGYPIRGIYLDSMLYLRNFETDRWPSGNPETGYLNTDGSPTKTEILNLRRQGKNNQFWQLNFGKRKEEELYNIKADPYCLINLSNTAGYADLKAFLKTKLENHLFDQEDLRMLGFGHLYEKYPMANGRGFYREFISGHQPKASWVNDSDFEAYYLSGDGKPLEPVFPAKKGD